MKTSTLKALVAKNLFKLKGIIKKLSLQIVNTVQQSSIACQNVE
jgi:hypothetical protein